MTYQPKPIDTSKVILSDDLLELTEQLAKNTHDVWSQQRLADGWTYGSTSDDTAKKHPNLVAYDELTDSEKEYDRRTTIETLKAIISMGYKIEKA
jgi:hypothetical protein